MTTKPSWLAEVENVEVPGLELGDAEVILDSPKVGEALKALAEKIEVPEGEEKAG